MHSRRRDRRPPTIQHFSFHFLHKSGSDSDLQFLYRCAPKSRAEEPRWRCAPASLCPRRGLRSSAECVLSIRRGDSERRNYSAPSAPLAAGRAPAPPRILDARSGLPYAIGQSRRRGDNSGVSHLNRITVNPNQCGGRPCIRGMRIRVKDILDLLAARVPEQEILADFPYLEPEDIQAALEYAAVQADHPVLTTA
jgi:uncharacterized protein (DUF433 family)